MKLVNSIFKTLIVLFLIPQFAIGDCDWTKIKKNPDKTYTYTEDLHLCVGKLVQSSKVQAQQIQDLTKAISLKDLAIQDSDKRAQTWMDTSGTLEKRLQEVDKLEKANSWLFFGLGMLATGLAAYTASKLK